MRKTKTGVLAPATERARRAPWLSVVLLLTAAAVLMSTPDRATAQEAGEPPPADSDGYVPVYRVCYQENEFATEWGGIYDLGALYVPYDNGSTIEGYILLNECALQRYGAGPNDIQHVLDHEMGHASGLADSTDPSSIMYPFYNITGT